MRETHISPVETGEMKMPKLREITEALSSNHSRLHSQQNTKLSGERAAEPQQQTEAESRRPLE
jgi:hypothetical protein